MTWSKFEFGSSPSYQKSQSKRNNDCYNPLNEKRSNNSCNIMVDTRVRRGSNFASPVSLNKEQKRRVPTKQKIDNMEKSNQKVSRYKIIWPVEDKSLITIIYLISRCV